MNATLDSGRTPLVGGKFLSFRLSREEYGVAILKVREIIGMVEVTVLPRTPAHVLGVINLRGSIVPVVDLRRRFGMAAAEVTNETCIVVVEAGVRGETEFRVGCVVDSVNEVLAIPDENCDAPPRCVDVDGDFLAGLARCGDRVLIVLDVDRIMRDLDPAALQGDVL